MRKFILKAVIIGLLPIIIMIIGYLVTPVGKNDVTRLFKNKIELLDSISSPKIIFVGGSNLRYGLNSKRIHDSLDINIVNYGLNSTVGLKYMIDNVSLFINKGDIVVIAPEWHSFYTVMYGTTMELAQIMKINNLKQLYLLDYHQLITLVTNIPRFLICNIFNSDNQKNINDHNKYGDYVAHKIQNEKYESHPLPITKNIDKNFCQYFIHKINEFQSKCTVILIPPACCDVAMKKWDKQVKEVENFLQESGHPFIIEPEKCTFKEEYMYDTDYHLNKKGLEIRTSLVIDALKNVLNRETTK